VKEKHWVTVRQRLMRYLMPKQMQILKQMLKQMAIDWLRETNWHWEI